MFHPLSCPLQTGVCFLLPPLPHTHGPHLRLACQCDLADGQDYHVPTTEPFHRLDFLFPPATLLVPYPFQSQGQPVALPIFLAKADSYRRPNHADEGSDENSHALVMRLLLLALSSVYSSQKNAALTDGFQDIVRGASHIQVGPVCMPS